MVEEAEKRYGLKLQEVRKQQVLEKAIKRKYKVVKQTNEAGKVKLVLQRREYR